MVHARRGQVRGVEIQSLGRAPEGVQRATHADAAGRLNLTQIVPLFDGSRSRSRVRYVWQKRSEEPAEHESNDAARDETGTASRLERGFHRGRP